MAKKKMNSKAQCNNDRGGASNGSYRNNSKRNSNYKSRREESKQPFDSDRTDAQVTNNAAMYYTNPQLAEQLSSISFSNFLGFDEDNVAFGKTDIPNAMTLYLNPCPGISTAGNISGINMAAQKMFTYLSASNAKTTIYAPQDIATLILAFGEVLSNIEVAKRTMRVAYTYNIRNRSLPIGIINAMGFNADFVKDGSLAQLRLQLNTVINSFNQLPIPSNIKYFDKVEGLYHTYYADAEGPMVQYYIFTPASTWILDEASNPEGSMLVTTSYKNASGADADYNRDLGKFIDVIADQISALLNSATLNGIYSDLLRLNQNSSFPLRTVELLGVDEVVLPEYNPMRLLQIHNSYAVGYPRGTENAHGLRTKLNDVVPYADNNVIEYLPVFTPRWIKPDQGFVLDFPHSMGNPDVDQRIDSTRFLAFLDIKAEDNTIDPRTSTISDHYVTAYRIYGPGLKDDNVLTFYSKLPHNVDQSYIASVAACLSKFDYHPPVWVPDQNVANPNYEVLCDYDFYTFIDRKYLIPVNELANQGIFEARF